MLPTLFAPIPLRVAVVRLALAFVALTLASAAAESPPPAARKPLDVVYLPTPHAVVDQMLDLAEVKPGDVVYDLGCGDGRIVVAAAKKYGVKAVGFELDPALVREARENVRAAGVAHLATIEQADIFTLDLRPASVIALYLLPELNVRLMPQLARLKPGSRIVSHDFAMKGAQPVAVQHVDIGDASNGGEETRHTIYKWVVPWQPESTRP